MNTLHFFSCTRMFLDTYDKSDFSEESAVFATSGSVITLLLVHSVMIGNVVDEVFIKVKDVFK